MTAVPDTSQTASPGCDMLQLIRELFPICRSITGNGVRQTLDRITQELPLIRHEVPSGSQVFDWQVPPEWNIRDASIRTHDGEKLVDFQQSNLHVVSYSQPVQQRMPLATLRSHLHSLPERPHWIPYKTSYYRPDWGFCLAHDLLLSMQEQDYQVSIDSEFDAHGSLTYGELFLPGRLKDEVLFSCHICHPSLANDNLASVAVAVQLAQWVASSPKRYSYRFLFAPGTIGAITWLARNPEARARTRHGLVLALLGSRHPVTYKRTRTGHARIDRILNYVLQQSTQPSRIVDFDPLGYDERQFGSPGIDMPIGRLSRAIQGEYPEYHTSADNLDLISASSLSDSLKTLRAVVDCLESDRVYRNCQPYAEAQLGRRGLYPLPPDSSRSSNETMVLQQALLWNLNQSDGATGLYEISSRSQVPIEVHEQAAELLTQHGLLSEVMDVDVQHGDMIGSSHGQPSVESLRQSARAHQLIPGGAHTYAKGDDQFPENAPRFFVRGQGCYVFDSDGNRFIEYGSGLRSVALGHAFPAVVHAAQQQMLLGSNFTRPTPLELCLAEELLELLPAADMVKFAKNGSDATTAAIRLARAKTGRQKVALCGDQPFFSVDDWFIGTTPMNAGIPADAYAALVPFPYNNIARLEEIFAEHRGQFACLIMEAETTIEPAKGYLHQVQELCRREGTLFVLDEMITGFRWHNGGAQAFYGLSPDLSTFGKALGNGFSVAALAGRREHMELGGIAHQDPRVFLLSCTHGAESHCLAAARATIQTYRQQPVIETLHRQGQRLRIALTELSVQLGIEQHFYVQGRSCNLTFVTTDQRGRRSQEFRTLLLQELVKQGIFAPSLVVSFAHRDEDIDTTVRAFEKALHVYRQALDEGVERYLVGKPSKPVFRKHN